MHKNRPRAGAESAQKKDTSALRRPRLYRRLVSVLDGRSRVIVQGANESDPVVVVTAGEPS
jgi:hypothetical protein